MSEAPGAPGHQPQWTSSDKNGVGTSLGGLSHVWFTHSHGILNEVYYPGVDQACLRDMELIVTDGDGFFSEEKRHTDTALRELEPGVPAWVIVNTCQQGRYRIEKEIITDPTRNVLLQSIRFIPSRDDDDLHLHVLMAPHIANRGYGNNARVGDYKGVPMLFAHRGNALALACSAGWLKRSVGFVGVSDGWQDLHQHGRMEWEYDSASEGNVALTGEIDWRAGKDGFVLALGFGRSTSEAGLRCQSSLNDGYDRLRSIYLDEWKAWHATLLPLDEQAPRKDDLYRSSVLVMRAHEDKRFPGGMIASLSVPWGSSKGDDDLGGYHLVWPRDLVETAGGLLAAGARDDVKRVIDYLRVTQDGDGHWAQNMWLDGTPYWDGIQMDETAFPILLVDTAWQEGLLNSAELADLWPMVRRAAGYVVRNGPVTQEDRWEEDPGYSPFTLAVEITALLAAAAQAEHHGESALAQFLRETADYWNESIEAWTYVSGTALAHTLDVEGYYVRIAPPDEAQAASPKRGWVPIKNRPPGQSDAPAAAIVSPDALALVRFGLRAADDPRILNTVKVIDAMLKIELPEGPCWHRYNEDGYGEHEDGSPFDGVGVGRAWPLLTGERGHYELARGNVKEAERCLRAIEKFANDGGMIPEQTWDAEDVPERDLIKGRPAGSAMPLVWAHAEYVKLRRSLLEKRLIDQPPHGRERYVEKGIVARHAIWRFNHKCRDIGPGVTLRLETLARAVVHWSTDGGKTVQQTESRDTGLGLWVADLPPGVPEVGRQIVFTFYWPDNDRWEGQHFRLFREQSRKSRRKG
jgi:glucoamylase